MPTLALDQFTLAATGFDFALQQPLFPGKLLLWGLFMLSLLSSAVIVSKMVSLFRMKRADEEFMKSFRGGRHPLHMFERNYEDPMSMRGLIYQYGAKETAFQMLGSPERDETFSVRLRSSEGLTDGQMKMVREALNRGEKAASAKLWEGMPLLSVATLVAPFGGLLGLAWILMKTFSHHGASGTLAEVSPGVSGALAMLVVGLVVGTLSLVGQILLGSACRERLRQLGDFRSEFARSVEYAFVLGNEMPTFDSAEDRALHHDQPLSAYDREGSSSESGNIDLEGDVIERAVATLESSAAREPFGSGEESPFVLIDEAEADSSKTAERPIAAFADPPPLEDDGFLFATPFAESDEPAEENVNPIAQQTTNLMAGSRI